MKFGEPRDWDLRMDGSATRRALEKKPSFVLCDFLNEFKTRLCIAKSEARQRNALFHLQAALGKIFWWNFDYFYNLHHKNLRKPHQFKISLRIGLIIYDCLIFVYVKVGLFWEILIKLLCHLSSECQTLLKMARSIFLIPPYIGAHFVNVVI